VEHIYRFGIFAHRNLHGDEKRSLKFLLITAHKRYFCVRHVSKHIFITAKY
jgi:hypothetical protein